MGDNNRKLEEFFRNQFNRPEQYDIPDEWNTPPDQTWSNIKDALTKKKDDKYPPIYFYKGIALLIIGLILILFLGHNYSIEKVKNQNLQEELKSTKQIIADLLNSPANEAIRKPKVENLGQSILNNDVVDLSSKTVILKDNNSAITISNYSKYTLDSEYQNNLNRYNSIDDGSVINYNSSHDESSKIIDQDGEKQKAPSIVNYNDKSPNEMNELLLLNSSIIQMLPTNFTLKNPVSTPIDIKESNSTFYAGLEIGTTLKVKERPSEFRGISIPQNSIVFENQFSSQNLGFKIGYQVLPNFSIESGLQYFNSSVNIDHNRLISISTLREIQDGSGNLIGGFNFDIPTSTGSIGTDVISSRRSSSSLDPEEEINIVINIDHNIDQLSIPLIARYSKTFGSFTAALRAGIVNTWNLNNELTVNDIQSSNEDFFFQSKTDPIGHNQNRIPPTYKLNYLVGLAMEYELSHGWRLYIEPSYTQSISPLFDNGRFQAFNKQVTINTGVKKLF